MKWLFGPLFLFPSLALAEIVDVNIRGASDVDKTSSVIIIYAGTAGSPANYKENNDGTIDNCTSDRLRACNQRRILSRNNLEIEFHSTTHTGRAVIADEDGIPIESDSTNIYDANERATVKVTWNDICTTMDSSQRFCEIYGNNQNFDLTQTFYIGINGENQQGTIDNALNDSDPHDDRLQIQIKVQKTMEDVVNRCPDPTAAENQNISGNGICDFTIFPGDNKVYLQDVQIHHDFPNSTNSILFNKVLLFFEPTQSGSCTDAKQISNSSPFIKQEIETNDETFSLKNDKFEKFTDDKGNTYLTNNKQYIFKVAVEDQAGNIGLFTADEHCTSGDINNSHIQIPSKVSGVLTKNFECFIATATYGSALEKHVALFRLFRDKVLNQTEFGRKFIHFYYKTSPPLAKWIQHSKILKTFFKFALAPLAVFAWLSLKIGLGPATCSLLLFFLVFFKIISRLRIHQRL